MARYDEYRADRHEKEIDDAVAAEGLVSLLGVPMVTGDDVLGVLFVATRTEHAFRPDRIALLSALADLALVALQTARTLHTARDTLGQPTAHLGERDRANAVHQELVQAVLAGQGYAPVVETLVAALERPVALVDPQGRLIAASGLPLAAAMLAVEPPAEEAIERSRASGHYVPVDTVPGPGGVAAITAGRQDFGALLVGEDESGHDELGAVNVRTVERAAQVCALLALQQAAVAEAEQRVENDLIADLLDAVPERRADVARRARQLGVAIEELDALLLFAMPGEHRAAAARTLGSLLGDRALVGEYRGFVVLAYPSHRIKADPEDVRARTARAIDAPVLDADPRTLRAFLDDTIGPVRRYDAERGTELMGTLRAFVRSGNSPTRAARALTFHTNTIIQRLDRLDQLLGAGWREDERLFRIGIAVRLDELRESLAKDG